MAEILALPYVYHIPKQSMVIMVDFFFSEQAAFSKVADRNKKVQERLDKVLGASTSEAPTRRRAIPRIIFGLLNMKQMKPSYFGVSYIYIYIHTCSVVSYQLRKTGDLPFSFFGFADLRLARRACENAP